MNTILNIDQLAARHAQKMLADTQNDKKTIDTLNRLVTKTLGVLQEQGVYAMMLFLFSRTGDEKKNAPIIRRELIEMLTKLPVFSSTTIPNSESNDAGKADREVLEFYSSDNVIGDLDTLFLVRDLYEQTLIYARYGAKAAAQD
jgi:hypothetical protein